MIYLELLNGRLTSYEGTVGVGQEGPVLGPLSFLRTWYGDRLTFGEHGTLELVAGLIFYDGVYYADWSALPADAVATDPALQSRVQRFEASKARRRYALTQAA